MRHITRPKGKAEEFLENPNTGIPLEWVVIAVSALLSAGVCGIIGVRADGFFLLWLVLLVVALWLVPAWARWKHHIEHPWWYKRNQTVMNTTYEHGKAVKRQSHKSFAEMYEEQELLSRSR